MCRSTPRRGSPPRWTPARPRAGSRTASTIPSVRPPSWRFRRPRRTATSPPAACDQQSLRRSTLMAKQTTEKSGIAQRLLGDHHSPSLSIALHRVPGVLIVAVYLLVAEPLVTTIGYPPLLGWAIAMALALAPVELGLLLWLGHRRN